MPNDPNAALTGAQGCVLQHAITFAVRVHSGQADKAGMPYILHPLRVMSALAPDLEAMTVAVLHDVLEDTAATVGDLQELLPQELVTDVIQLTRLDSESYAAYVRRMLVEGSRRALQVKLEDLRDNMLPWRAAQLPERHMSLWTRGAKTFARVHRELQLRQQDGER